MALDRLTKVDGTGIHTLSNIISHNINSSGIVTATKFVGPVEGSITATDATFSGNVSIAGTLTYEDVTNIDSVGIITARNGIDCNGDIDVDGHTNLDNVSVAGVTTFSDTVHVGTGVTILSNGKAEFTGFTTFAQGLEVPFYKPINIGSSLYGKIHYPSGGSALEMQALNQIKFKCWDGNSFETGLHISGVGGQVKIGGSVMGNNGSRQPELSVTGHTTQSITMKSSDGSNLTERFRLSQSGFNFTGLSTHTGNFDLDGDIDVDGHTNLDNGNVAGIVTFNSGAALHMDGGQLLLKDRPDGNSNNLFFGTGGKAVIYHDGTNFSQVNNTGHFYLGQGVGNKDLMLYAQASGNVLLQQNTGVRYVKGVGSDASVQLFFNNNLRLNTTTAGVSIPKDLDVDGHTNLDNVSIAGVSTVYGHGAFGSTVDITGDLAISDTIKHIGDSNTKIRFPAVDTFSVETAGSTRLHIHSDGRFRVGCTAQPSSTVTGFQIDADLSTLRLMSGAGASGTNTASISLGGSNHNSNIENGANSGAQMNLYNYNTSDGNSSAVSFMNSSGLSASRILGLNVSHSSRTGALVFMTSSGSHPTEKLRITSGGLLKVNSSDSGSYHTIRLNTTTNNAIKDVLHVHSSVDGAIAAAGYGVRLNFSGEQSNGNEYTFGGIAGLFNSTGATYGDLAFYTNNNGTNGERLRILSNGNISVGSNGAAAEKFQVNGGSIAIVGGAGYKIDTHPLVTYASFSAISGGSYAARLGSTGTSTLRSTQIYGGGSHIATFDGVNTRLGINETVPRATLDVRGTAIISDDTGNYPSTYPPADTQLLVYTSTTGQPITNTNCARLCIATDAKQVGAQGYNGAIDFGNSDVTASGSNAQFNWRVASIMSNAAGDTGNDPTADGDLQFWTKASSGSLTQRVTITAEGRFSINETSPSGIFHVRGAGNTDADAMFFESGSSGTGAKFILMTNDNSDRSKYIQHSAYWTEIGCHNNEGVRFRESDGDIRFYMNGSSGNYNFTGSNISDRNLKENIETITTNSIDLIKQVVPRTFNWKYDRKNIPHGGFIAQEMQPLFPKLINGVEYDESRTDDGDPNEPDAGKCNPTGMGFDYNGYTAYLTKAMQELIAKVEALEAEVASLKGS